MSYTKNNRGGSHKASIERFLKTPDLTLERGYGLFGISALEYAHDRCRAVGEEEKAVELKKKIGKLKNSQFYNPLKSQPPQ